MIELPWPPKELHPNARVHFHTKARIYRGYREDAYWLTEKSGAEWGEGSARLRIMFHPPDRRKRDLDGMISAIKAGIDGIADALKVNDHLFGLTLDRGEPVKGGKVIVTIEGSA